MIFYKINLSELVELQSLHEKTKALFLNSVFVCVLIPHVNIIYYCVVAFLCRQLICPL